MNKQLRLMVHALMLSVLVSCSEKASRSSDSDGEGDSRVGGDAVVPSNVSTPVLRQTLAASWDENWFASVAVFDLDHDGTNEIIAGRHSVLYVWKADGTPLWRAPVGEDSGSSNDHGSSRQYASPVVGDLDGDEYGEIAIAYDNAVAVYDHDGKFRPGWPVTFPGSSGELRSIAAIDLDDDGKLEILAQKTAEGPVTVAFHLDGSVMEGWPQVRNCSECGEFGGYNQNIGAADMTGDGVPEVVSTYDCASIGIMSATGAPLAANAAFEGPYFSSVPMFHDLDLAKQGWGGDGNDRDEFTDSPPVFGDLTGDGLPELIVYSDHELAGEYKNRGNCLWALFPDISRVPGFEQPICSAEPLFTEYQNNIVQVAPAPALGQLSEDNRPEIVVPSYDGRMRCFSPDGTMLWAYVFDTAGDPFIGASGAAIGDLDNNGIPEIVFATYSTAEDVSHLIVLNADGQTLHKVPISGRGDMSVPTLVDVDGDGSIEILISLKDALGGGQGGVQIWDVDSAKTGDALPWPTGRGNFLRNGQLE